MPGADHRRADLLIDHLTPEPERTVGDFEG
jgi:hypothetical protein